MTTLDDQPEDLGQIDDLLTIRPRRMQLPEADIDITPMIDITFLLLVFFLVASAIASQTPVNLPEARYGDAVSADEAAVVTIAADGTGGAAIYKGDGINDNWRLTSSSLPAQEDELAEYMQSQFDSDSGKRHVLIKAAKEVRHRHVVRVSHAAGRVLTSGQLYVAVAEEE